MIAIVVVVVAGAGEAVVRRGFASACSDGRQRRRASTQRQRPASQPLLQALPAARQKV